MNCFATKIAEAYDTLPDDVEVTIINTQSPKFTEQCDEIIRQMLFRDDRRAYNVKLTVVSSKREERSPTSYAKTTNITEQCFNKLKSKILEYCGEENFKFATAIVTHEEFARCKGATLSRKVVKYYIFA